MESKSRNACEIKKKKKKKKKEREWSQIIEGKKELTKDRPECSIVLEANAAWSFYELNPRRRGRAVNAAWLDVNHGFRVEIRKQLRIGIITGTSAFI